MLNDKITSYILMGIGVFLNLDALIVSSGSLTIFDINFSFFGFLFIGLATGVAKGMKSPKFWATFLCGFPVAFGLFFIVCGACGYLLNNYVLGDMKYDLYTVSFYLFNVSIILIYGLPMYLMINTPKNTNEKTAGDYKKKIAKQ